MRSSCAALFILITTSVASISFSSLMEYFAALMLCAYSWQCFSPALLFVCWGDWCVPTPRDTDPFAQDKLQELSHHRWSWSWLPSHAFPFFLSLLSLPIKSSNCRKGTCNCTSIIKRWFCRSFILKCAQKLYCSCQSYSGSYFSKARSRLILPKSTNFWIASMAAATTACDSRQENGLFVFTLSMPCPGKEVVETDASCCREGRVSNWAARQKTKTSNDPKTLHCMGEK